MEIFNFLILVALVYLSLILGRMWMKDDIFRRFKSIEEEGETLRRPEDVCQLINSLRDKVRLGNNKIEMLESCYETATSKLSKLEGDYKNLMEQMKAKREEVEELKKTNQKNASMRNKYAQKIHKLNESMKKFYQLAYEINDKCVELSATDAQFAHGMNKNIHKFIFANMLLNKTTILTVGPIEIAKNGKVTYHEGSLSLGNAKSKENIKCFGALTSWCNLNPGDYKAIGVISDFDGYRNSGDIHKGITKSIDEIVHKSADLMDELESKMSNN